MKINESYNKNKPPIIVGGTGGSGTRVLGEILKTSNIYIGHDLNGANDSRDLKDFFSTRLGHAYKMLVHQTAIKPNWPDDFERAIKNHCSKFQDQDQWGWKNPKSIFFMPFLNSIFPQMKFIHLIRDGRDMALSKNQKQVMTLNKLELKRDVLPEDSIKLWSSVNVAAYNFGRKYLGGRYLLIRYEDLIEGPEKNIKTVLDFVESQMPVDEFANIMRMSKGVGRYRNLPQDQQTSLNMAGQEGLKLFGYRSPADTHLKFARRRQTDQSKPAVDFLIAGVQKSGTTALHKFLSEHENIFLPPKKELHFFDNENFRWNHINYNNYEQHFRAKKTGQIAGEATPIYLYWPGALARIKKYNPNMKLIICLRNPIDRAYSQWKMQFARGVETLEFSEAIRAKKDRGIEDKKSKNGRHRVYSYIDRGLYVSQLRRLFSQFPKDQILILTQDEMETRFTSFLDKICDFLDVEHFEPYPDNEIIRPANSNADFGPMSETDRVFLTSIMRDDILTTGRLTGLNVSNWL